MKYLLLILLSITTFYLTGQENETPETKEKKQEKPVIDPWAGTVLIDNQTTLSQKKGSLELIIQHRFGKIKELSDLFGLYAPSNIRMAIGYGITNKLAIGFGTEKNNKLQDFYLKYAIFTQTRSGNIPLSLSYYGNMAIDAREDELFGEEYKFTNRLSYFNELILSRKFTERLSILASVNYSHFNQVDSAMSNDALGITYGGRFKIYNEVAFMVEGNHPVIKHDQNPQKPSIGFGFEIATNTHAFQVFAASFRELVYQKNFVYNQNDFSEDDWFLGFNINVKLK